MERELALLVVDDDPSICELVSEILSGAGYRVRTARGGCEALSILSEDGFAGVLLDISMPEMNGLEFLERYRASGGEAPVAIISAHASSENVVKAMKLGACDYLTKPLEKEELLNLARALGGVELRSGTVVASRPQHQAQAANSAVIGSNPSSDGEPDETIVSNSPAMKQIRMLIERVANTDVPILLLGESGVGKEVVAREIHRCSHRNERPFLKINCAALPSELLESELFGHERGAFTGAVAEKPGKFELAHRGTMFLDEIGEMAIRLQAKLLQVLQDEEFFRVGGKKSVRVDARILCATNRKLEAEIENGNFREDLFYRLNVVAIEIPPLRERREDIRPLFNYFARKYGRKYNVAKETFTDDLMREILSYDFPGNVRELENLVRRLVVLRDPEGVMRELRNPKSLTRESVVPTALQPAPPQFLHLDLEEDIPLKDLSRHAAMLAEREAIINMLAKTAWNKRKAAVRLKISYKALLYKIKECGIVDPRQLMSQRERPLGEGKL